MKLPLDLFRSICILIKRFKNSRHHSATKENLPASHFPGCYSAIGDRFTVSSGGKRGGDGEKAAGDASVYFYCSRRGKKKKEKRGEFTPPLCPACGERRHSNHMACSQPLAGKNLLSPKCQSCSGEEKGRHASLWLEP